MSVRAKMRRFESKEYRLAYVPARIRSTIALQVRMLRESLGLTQGQFAKRIGKPQSVVSRLENPEAGQVAVQTLIDVAQALDVALIVRFASYPQFIEAMGDTSPQALAVHTFAESQEDAQGLDFAKSLIRVAAPAANWKMTFYGGGAAVMLGADGNLAIANKIRTATLTRDSTDGGTGRWPTETNSSVFGLKVLGTSTPITLPVR